MILKKYMAFAVGGAYEKVTTLGRAVGVAENGESGKDKFFEVMDKIVMNDLQAEVSQI